MRRLAIAVVVALALAGCPPRGNPQPMPPSPVPAHGYDPPVPPDAAPRPDAGVTDAEVAGAELWGRRTAGATVCPGAGFRFTLDLWA